MFRTKKYRAFRKKAIMRLMKRLTFSGLQKNYNQQLKEEQEKKEREDSRNRKFAKKIQDIEENKRKRTEKDTFSS